MTVALDRELETFNRELPRLLQEEASRGKYALIHGDQVDSFWDTKDLALEAGYNRFGIEPFLVKLVTEHEEPRYFSRSIKRCH